MWKVYYSPSKRRNKSNTNRWWNFKFSRNKPMLSCNHFAMDADLNEQAPEMFYDGGSPRMIQSEPTGPADQFKSTLICHEDIAELPDSIHCRHIFCRMWGVTGFGPRRYFRNFRSARWSFRFDNWSSVSQARFSSLVATHNTTELLPW